jgi:hypothetical protein
MPSKSLPMAVSVYLLSSFSTSLWVRLREFNLQIFICSQSQLREINQYLPVFWTFSLAKRFCEKIRILSLIVALRKRKKERSQVYCWSLLKIPSSLSRVENSDTATCLCDALSVQTANKACRTSSSDVTTVYITFIVTVLHVPDNLGLENLHYLKQALRLIENVEMLRGSVGGM